MSQLLTKSFDREVGDNLSHKVANSVQSTYSTTWTILSTT